MATIVGLLVLTIVSVLSVTSLRKGRRENKREQTGSTTGFYTDASTHTAICMLMYAEMS